MMGRRMTGIVAALLLACAGTAWAAADDELPSWPHEQQAMLRDVEQKIVEVRRELFKARMMDDKDAVAAKDEEFRKLQEKRVKLIHLTKDQLPAQ